MAARKKAARSTKAFEAEVTAGRQELARRQPEYAAKAARNYQSLAEEHEEVARIIEAAIERQRERGPVPRDWTARLRAERSIAARARRAWEDLTG